MKHLFVTYKIAKLLKEKGFNEMCFAYYPSTCLNPDLLIPSQYKETAIFYDRPHNTLTLAPMPQQAVDFIREKLDIQINITWNKFYEKTPYQYEYRPTWRNEPVRPYGFGGMSETYNEALNSAIEGALNYKPE